MLTDKVLSAAFAQYCSMQTHAVDVMLMSKITEATWYFGTIYKIQGCVHEEEQNCLLLPFFEASRIWSYISFSINYILGFPRSKITLCFNDFLPFTSHFHEIKSLFCIYSILFHLFVSHYSVFSRLHSQYNMIVNDLFLTCYMC